MLIAYLHKGRKEAEIITTFAIEISITRITLIRAY